ncbi:hypothetical protein UFOVP816_7 [uncultured Caudovirales phage]|uniref:Uncharacterized protein n=1 Tax=uncultured Caudovirales phage TaxID=2100421 RepID=A0A6J5NXK5_9CAUD|nr:hypothetical protein UFOVP816_7 [uncultured Caudovirales phage]
MKKLFNRVVLGTFILAAPLAADQIDEIDQIIAESVTSEDIITSDVSYSEEYSAYNAYETTLGGYRFHIAQYDNGQVIVTALDGQMKGFQSIGLNGVQIGWSTIVEYHSKYFVHTYSTCKVFTYKNKQVCKFF